MNEKDEEMLKAVKAFNPYDLYSKSDDPPKVEELKVCETFSIAVTVANLSSSKRDTTWDS